MYWHLPGARHQAVWWGHRSTVPRQTGNGSPIGDSRLERDVKEMQQRKAPGSLPSSGEPTWASLSLSSRTGCSASEGSSRKYANCSRDQTRKTSHGSRGCGTWSRWEKGQSAWAVALDSLRCLSQHSSRQWSLRVPGTARTISQMSLCLGLGYTWSLG